MEIGKKRKEPRLLKIANLRKLKWNQVKRYVAVKEGGGQLWKPS